MMAGQKGLDMLKLEIRTGNGCFHEEDEDCVDYLGRLELARLLEEVAEQLRNGSSGDVIVEVNGNRCGTWSLTAE